MRDEVPGRGGLNDETRAYLTCQQRHLLLAGPISRLSRERRVIFRVDHDRGRPGLIQRRFGNRAKSLSKETSVAP